ncbi:Holliday junction branch migration protein RuvA [Pannus brasiliensis CCIBt3594]|uniref:Holliday junction branch migration complex subunit RuvA n=1 Tax=Pannus brasiliensis CCIBt3594 TaxID=1427578 RepID=A0AAW9QMV0_9CHRO
MTIHYLRGKAIEVIEIPVDRPLLILEVNGIGYEIQIPGRSARSIATTLPESLQIFTHLQIREEQPYLYGFESVVERDLFRQLIAVNGVGARLGIALIDTLGSEDLVGAIVTGDSKTLAKTPGVGTKTAERIALELKTKLAKWRQVAGISSPSGAALPAREILEDVEMTLLALGYSADEIDRAVAAIAQDPRLRESSNGSDWIKSAITWLS